ncbi:lanthionine synthetase C family protein [Streptomyces sp. PTM05]|uniref:Lanthionine synthetase C family protein n=1 Tax=Streptantibioticus parmotrematis TaxID=2873249 RepID=A0ABS7R1Z2_9ACTN|nr:lanthionine synthetase C family protein [Streptantibioticus parmotrematis]MBY8889218.1 lanthionine synthetase C family protein [Streptantibioticus parmotrematis]
MTSPLALEVADAVADLLADPNTAPVSPRTTTTDRQQLAYGPLGIALLHIERAAADRGPWQRAQAWLAAATREPFTSGPDSHPFYGAPALAHAVACAADHQPASYQRALRDLDAQIDRDVRRRLDAAHRRIDAGELPELAEFDVIRGLSGYGAHLLHRDPLSPTLSRVLHYCVRLAEPVGHDGERLPGWWAASGPSGRPDERFPGGHANSGMAHGIGGVLALLALAARQGNTVGGHYEAIRTILAWLDRWRENGPGPAWPYWVTRDELRDGRLAPVAPRRPSWCYGTVGLARAQQLAALALGDSPRQAEAENDLVAAITNSAQLKATVDDGLCHGISGLAHVAARTAADALPSTASQIRTVIPALLSVLCPPGAYPAAVAAALLKDEGAGPGFLDGAAGTAFALLAPASAASPVSAWDSCLLLA